MTPPAQTDPVDCVSAVFDKAEEPDRCRCKGIVLKAYAALREDGMSDREAIRAATRVLRYHHPSPSVEAKTVVECWVFEHTRGAVH